SSPSGDGNQAVEVAINTTVPLFLSQVIKAGATLPVGTQSFAELKANAAGCIIALASGGTGVTLSGGTAVTASACAVDSNNSETVPCGTSITTISVYYDASPPSQGCSGIQAPSGHTLSIVKALTADPLAGNADVAGAVGRLTGVAALTSPSIPSVPSGTSIDFAYSQSTTQSEAAAAGCSASYSSNTWTLTCPSGGTYDFGTITTGGGITVAFNTSGSASTTYNFSGDIHNTGTAMAFGPGTYHIAGGIITGGGTTTSFGAGTFNIGKASTKCSGAGYYSICNTGTSLTFGGPSAFNLSAGIYNSGGESLTLGAGSTNSYVIGESTDGNSINMGGGAKTFFADATTGLFELIGNLNDGSAGGSCLNLPAAAEHDIDGDMTAAGGVILGAGVYTVHGYIALGASGGGTVTCWGSTVGMTGSSVTMITDGSSTPSSGNCQGEAFCIGAGFSQVTLIAPTSGDTANLAVIGPQSSSNTAGASFNEGSSNVQVAGAFYFPWGPVSFSGAASLGSANNGCLELIGSEVTLSGGSALASSCSGLGQATGATVALVQ
ncbi:MAG: hypothetical protein ACRED8_01790, partial [Caulobacteraceae bacterium]